MLVSRGGAHLFPLVESLPVAVGKVNGSGSHSFAGFDLLQRSLHLPAARALPEEREDQ